MQIAEETTEPEHQLSEPSQGKSPTFSSAKFVYSSFKLEVPDNCSENGHELTDHNLKENLNESSGYLSSSLNESFSADLLNVSNDYSDIFQVDGNLSFSCIRVQMFYK